MAGTDSTISAISTSRLLILIALGFVAGADAALHRSLADGAVALGRPADVSKGGVATGVSYNYDDRAVAQKRALDECRSSKDAPQSTRDLCKLITYYKDHCVAVSLDPKAGTPGFGWSVGIDKTTAEQEAKASCIATAGKSREKFCVVSLLHCDGTPGGASSPRATPPGTSTPGTIPDALPSGQERR
jgi:hypothetical protein